MARTVASLLALVAASCLATPKPQIPPIYDSQIVFGHRVGPVSLGMSESQLRDAVGEPSTTNDYSAFRAGRKGYVYNRLGLSLIVQDGDVVRITPSDNRYSTASGIRVGVPMPENTSAGASKRDRSGITSYCFDGTTGITVRSSEEGPAAPGCAVGTICDIVIGDCLP